MASQGSIHITKIVNASRACRGQTGVHDQREVPRLKLGVRVAAGFADLEIRDSQVMICNAPKYIPIAKKGKYEDLKAYFLL